MAARSTRLAASVSAFVVLSARVLLRAARGSSSGTSTGPCVRPPYAASARARAAFRRLLVADLHADSLLWGRDLLVRRPRGHVDVPRLIEGGVAIQAFTVVSKTPRGLNIERNDDRTDNVTLLALAQGWPPKTWTSLEERAAYQARRLHRTAALSAAGSPCSGPARDLEALPRATAPRSRASPPASSASRGPRSLEGELDNVEVLFRAGYRMVGLAHFFDNEMARLGPRRREGRAHPGRAGGREAGSRREGMLVDLAHASAAHHRRRARRGHAAGGRLPHRRARHLRQRPQPERRPAPAHRRAPAG